MSTTSYTTTVVVDKSPKETFDAITNVHGWWSEEVEGGTSKLNDEFNYHFEDLHRCKIRVIESVPGKKLVWLVLDNHFKFTKDTTEWIGTKIIFEISEKGGKTRIHFTHEGLVPDYECYEICMKSWDQYIGQSLVGLINTGKGQPNATGKPTNDGERKLRSSTGNLK